ncbi:hypothetical protein M8Z33_15565 [Streptomyces sp. ZAF1911]|uniref:hypothetical protein n=1 Tax=Streptomyces sp. ZAF1911 TaxID=2944129 RepID=UPI00237B08CC|nr:hypothetical protein [Streptomyces sp. ZAF1911]MDD9378047.1 hypothetical protein [Streptomyces sp. ZAF1911]
MQFKRIAAVAAAAVVGPTVLMTTPAMADDQQQPAVSVPDSVPEADPAPAAVTPPVTPPVSQPGTPESRPATTPPAPVTPAPAPAPATGSKTPKDAPRDSILMGPDIKISGIPKDGFKRDGGWTPLTVTIDNTGHIEVANLTPRVSVDRADGKLKAEHFKLQYLTENGTWKPAEWVNPDEPSSMSDFSVGAPRTIPRGGSSTVKVRISFSADTPVIAFDMTSDGLSIRPDGGRAWAPANWYKAKIAGAASVPEEHVGPALRIDGVPENLPVGGWQDLSVHIDNSGKKAVERFDLHLGVARPDWSRTKPSDFQVQYYGKDGWHTGELQLEDGAFVIKQLGGVPVAAGQSLDLKIRVRFAPDVRLGDMIFYAMGQGQTGPGESDWVGSRTGNLLTRLVAPVPVTEPPVTQPPATKPPANNPGPNGGSTPIVAPGTGTPPGGELATTGSSPATTWALGGAGVTLAMGAALIAGTGRHRRRDTTA